MTEFVAPEDAGERLKRWLDHATLPNDCFRRALSQALVGGAKAKPNDPILHKISLELIVQLLPAALEGVMTGDLVALRRLAQAEEIVRSIQELVAADFDGDLSSISSWERIAPPFKNIEDLLGDRYISGTSYLSQYKQYVELGAVSVTLERLLVLISAEQTLLDRAKSLRGAVAASKLRASGWEDFLKVFLGSALLAIVGARVWAWLEFGNDYADPEYVMGWMIGRAVLIFMVLAALAGVGAFKSLGEDMKRRSDGWNSVQAFGRSALVALRAEATVATQARLLDLANLSEREGVALADPGTAILRRSATRSSDDWLLA